MPAAIVVRSPRRRRCVAAPAGPRLDARDEPVVARAGGRTNDNSRHENEAVHDENMRTPEVRKRLDPARRFPGGRGRAPTELTCDTPPWSRDRRWAVQGEIGPDP